MLSTKTHKYAKRPKNLNDIGIDIWHSTKHWSTCYWDLFSTIIALFTKDLQSLIFKLANLLQCTMNYDLGQHLLFFKLSSIALIHNWSFRENASASVPPTAILWSSPLKVTFHMKHFGDAVRCNVDFLIQAQFFFTVKCKYKRMTSLKSKIIAWNKNCAIRWLLTKNVQNHILPIYGNCFHCSFGIFLAYF